MSICARHFCPETCPSAIVPLPTQTVLNVASCVRCTDRSAYDIIVIRERYESKQPSMLLNRSRVRYYLKAFRFVQQTYYLE